MLRQPEPLVAPPLGVLGEVERVPERVRGGRSLDDRGEVEHGEGRQRHPPQHAHSRACGASSSEPGSRASPSRASSARAASRWSCSSAPASARVPPGVQPGGVRQQWGTRVACRLAAESVAFWRDADERLASRMPLTFQQCGYLFAAHGEATLDRLAANVALQNEEGIRRGSSRPTRRRSSFPGSSPTARRRRLVRRGRVLRPAAGRRRGVRRRARRPAPRRPGDRARRSRLARGRARGRRGRRRRRGRLARSSSRDCRSRPRSATSSSSDPIPERLLEPLVVAPELGFAAKQLADGRVLASDLAGQSRERIRARGRALLPHPRVRLVPLLVPGVYDVTPDHQPILGQVDDGLYVACGFAATAS